MQAVDIEADEDRLRKILAHVVDQDNADGNANAGLRLVITPSFNDLVKAEEDALNTDGTVVAYRYVSDSEFDRKKYLAEKLVDIFPIRTIYQRQQ